MAFEKIRISGIILFVLVHAARAHETTPLGALIDPVTEARQENLVSTDYHGLAVQIHNADDALDRYGRMIEEIADLGANCVLISVNGYQRRVDSVLIETDKERTPCDEELLQLFAKAHRCGLSVIFMPKILIRDPRSGEWRGKIRPTTWDGWFDQYRKFLLHLARLAQEGRVEVFMVGSELVTTERFTDQWTRTINRVREVYSGKLSYSANWDHYTSVQFWDRLDLMGMTSYYKLADKTSPDRRTLRSSWQKIRKDILAFQAKVNRPIVFTEAGWCSQEGCSVAAWNYYRNEKASKAGLDEQRLNYEVFIETWADEPAVGGIIWWEWTNDYGGASDFGYTPRNKPAERLLRDLFAAKTANKRVSDRSCSTKD